IRPRPGLLRFLPFDAGLRSGAQGERHAHGAEAGFGILPLFRRSVRPLQCFPARARCLARAHRRCTRSLIAAARPMTDFLVALGLVFVLEGLVFAAFPDMAKRAMESVTHVPDQMLRVVGIASALIGLLLVWIIRG